MKRLTCTMVFDKELSDRQVRPVYLSQEGYDSSNLGYKFLELLRHHYAETQGYAFLERYYFDLTTRNRKVHVIMSDNWFRSSYDEYSITFDVDGSHIVPSLQLASRFTADIPPLPTIALTLSMRKCKKCGQPMGNDAMPLDSGILLCDNCSQMYRYGSDNFAWKYGETQGAQSFGFELELSLREGYTSRNTAKTSRYTNLLHRLILAGFLRTGDGTVDDEMKSPIYSVTHVPGNLKKILDIASEFTAHPNVGTHTHVYYPHMDAPDSHHVRRLYACLYLLEEYLVTHKDSTKAVWGRYFTGYAHFPMNASHGSWVQLRNHTIEWRLAKLTSYRQFNKLVQFLVSTTELIKKSLNNAETAEKILERYISRFGLSQNAADTSLWEGYNMQHTTVESTPYGGYENYPELFDRNGYYRTTSDIEDDDYSIFDDVDEEEYER